MSEDTAPPLLYLKCHFLMGKNAPPSDLSYAPTSVSSHRPPVPPLCQSRGGRMLNPGVTFCRESEKLQIARRWSLFWGRSPGWEGEQVQPQGQAWQVGVHRLPWETLGCFPGKGIVCRRDISRRQAAVHFGVGSSSHQFLKDGGLDLILLRGPPKPLVRCDHYRVGI